MDAIIYLISGVIGFIVFLFVTRYVFRIDNIITLLAAILDELKKMNKR